MEFPDPDPVDDLRGWLQMQVPVGFGVVIGVVIGVQFAPSPLLAAVTTLVCGLLGLVVGVALVSRRPSETTG